MEFHNHNRSGDFPNSHLQEPFIMSRLLFSYVQLHFRDLLPDMNII